MSLIHLSCLFLKEENWRQKVGQQLLRTGVGNFFWKGPESRYFRLCRSGDLCLTYSTPPSQSEHSHGRYVSKWEHGSVPIQLYLQNRCLLQKFKRNTLTPIGQGLGGVAFQRPPFLIYYSLGNLLGYQSIKISWQSLVIPTKCQVWASGCSDFGFHLCVSELFQGQLGEHPF